MFVLKIPTRIWRPCSSTATTSNRIRKKPSYTNSRPSKSRTSAGSAIAPGRKLQCSPTRASVTSASNPIAWPAVSVTVDDARISCLACHDPHREVNANLLDYDAKCLACHGGRKPGTKNFPKSKQSCVTCHMPKLELPGAHFKFSDHRIRIVKPNEPFPG